MKQISNSIAAAVESLFSIKREIDLTRPEPQFGDYATNVAMTLAKDVGAPPRDIAQQIIDATDSPLIAHMDIAGPGFINIRLSDEAVASLLKTEHVQVSKPMRIMVEFGHPNTHKMPHIGHAFSYFAGESIARLLEYQGHTIKRANYQGDIGPHVAKCLYGWLQLDTPRPEDVYDRVKTLQQAYQHGSELYEDEAHKTKIDEINRSLYQDDSPYHAHWNETRQWSLDYYDIFEKRINVGEQHHYLESAIWKRGKDTVLAHTPSVFEESDGAIVYRGEQDGLHTRVFVTQAGTTTYEGKEMGLIAQKVDDWDFDLNITPTAAEQNEYFQVVFAAAAKVYPELAEKLTHIGFGFVNLTTGKMSSRSGSILSAPELVDTVLEQVEAMQVGNEHVPEELKNQTNAAIALGAIKFGFLRSTLTKNITFDPDSSLDLQGDTGPYVQYTHARIASIIRKVGNEGSAPSGQALTDQERQLILKNSEFEAIARRAAEQREPHLVCSYLIELCREFNSYYASTQIAESDNEAERVYIIGKIKQTLATGLSLVGVDAPDYM